MPYVCNLTICIWCRAISSYIYLSKFFVISGSVVCTLNQPWLSTSVAISATGMWLLTHNQYISQVLPRALLCYHTPQVSIAWGSRVTLRANSISTFPSIHLPMSIYLMVIAKVGNPPRTPIFVGLPSVNPSITSNLFYSPDNSSFSPFHVWLESYLPNTDRTFSYDIAMTNGFWAAHCSRTHCPFAPHNKSNLRFYKRHSCWPLDL